MTSNPHSCLLLLGAVAVAGATATFAQSSAQGIRLTAGLVPEKTSFMVGEPIYLTFIIRNDGDQDVRFLFGVNEDGCNELGRPGSFLVQAVSTDGAVVPVPDSPGRSFCNGMTAERVLRPQIDDRVLLFLPHWAAIITPADYVITARRRLRMSSGPGGVGGATDITCALNLEARATVRVTPFDDARFGAVITARGLETLGADQDRAEAAARALAAFDDPRAVSPLAAAAMKGTYDVKRTVLGALARFPTSDAAAALTRAVGDADANIRHIAAIALTRNTHSDAVRAVVALMNHPDLAIRNTVLQAFARMDSTESLAHIRAMTQDPAPIIRQEAERFLRERQAAGGGRVAWPSDAGAPSPLSYAVPSCQAR